MAPFWAAGKKRGFCRLGTAEGGDFSGHYSVVRGQKAWFLPGARSPLRSIGGGGRLPLRLEELA
jgi:hypothetical protein